MWKITAQNENETEILLYDVIADFEDEKWGYISAKALINKIKALGNIKNIVLRINSTGGYVFEAQAMYNYLKGHPANITVKIDGLAASAASLVAMSGNKIIMPENAFIMIHNPSGFAFGESEDLKKEANVLDMIRDVLVNAYISKTGLDREKIISMMNEETWLTAREALDLNFCDEIEPAEQIAAVATKTGNIICKTSSGFSKFEDLKIPEKLKVQQESENKLSNNSQNQNPKNTEEIQNTVNEAEFNRGVQAERERLRMLDSLNAPGREEIIARAKYEDPKDARDIAMELLKADTNNSALNARRMDASSVNNALPPQKTMQDNKAEDEAIIDSISNEINRMRGYR